MNLQLSTKDQLVKGMLKWGTLITVFFMINLLKNSSQNTPKTVYAQTDITCSQKVIGDANCDGTVDERDYEIWNQQYDQMVSSFPESDNANFMCVARNSTTYFVDLTDYEIWRRNTVSGLGEEISPTSN